MSNADSGILDDVRIGVRLKIAALWIAMLFLFAVASLGATSPSLQILLHRIP
jgi:hypothetical protein